MKAVIQRVYSAKVVVDTIVVGEIGKGLLIFLGVHKNDGPADVDFMARKLVELRIFEDANSKMNCSAQDVGAHMLVVSQFTLYGDCSKGRRPSFDKAAPLGQAEEIYNLFVTQLKESGLKVETGVFRAMMDVHLVNDGPVTLIMES